MNIQVMKAKVNDVHEALKFQRPLLTDNRHFIKDIEPQYPQLPFPKPTIDQ